MMSVCLADDVALNLHVHHNEISAIKRVRHDASHEGSCQHDSVRSLLIEEFPYGMLVSQIQFLMSSFHQIRVASTQQIVPYRTSHQSFVPSDVYF